MSRLRALSYVALSAFVVLAAAALIARTAAAEAASGAVEVLTWLEEARLEPATDRILGRMEGETVVVAVGIARALVGEDVVLLPAPPVRWEDRILLPAESAEAIRKALRPAADENAPEGAPPPPAARNTARETAREETAPWDVVRVIVIDPGHGGKDGGAKGPSGLMEKDVVLDISRRAAEVLRARRRAREVHLTRDEDVFVPLPRRVEIARQKQADLFVSIHANANRRRSAGGAEVYFFNDPSDEDAARLAEAEGKFEMEDVNVNPVLFDLMIQGNVVESSGLAREIQWRLPRALGVADRGVKSARFYVLHYGVVANIPSVLVETAFISNPDEERLLADAEARQRAAEAIAEAIVSYAEELEARYPGGEGWRR